MFLLFCDFSVRVGILGCWYPWLLVVGHREAGLKCLRSSSQVFGQFTLKNWFLLIINFWKASTIPLEMSCFNTIEESWMISSCLFPAKVFLKKFFSTLHYYPRVDSFVYSHPLEGFHNLV